MEFVPPGQRFAHPGDSLALPDNIMPALDLAFGLRDEDRERLDRALIFFEQGKSVWRESRSLSYIAHVIAIEALMDRPERCEVCDQALLEENERCNTCDQALLGTTRAFREFLETHAPVIREEPYTRNRLYRLRSDLAHGNDVILGDMFPSSGVGEHAREESILEETLHSIAGTAIRGWLHSRAQVGS